MMVYNFVVAQTVNMNFLSESIPISDLQPMDWTYVSTISCPKPEVAWRATLRVFLLVLLGLSLTAMIGVVHFLVAACHGVSWTLTASVALLSTTDHERESYPWFFWWLRSTFFVAIYWFDFNVLGGRRYAGREWTQKGGFVWDAPKFRVIFFNRGQQMLPSWKKTLLELPPPAVKRLGRRLSLDPNYVSAWMNHGTSAHCQNDPKHRQKIVSCATAQHMTAIHFCYAMLHEDQLLHQVRKRSIAESEESQLSKMTLQVLDEIQASHSEEWCGSESLLQHSEYGLGKQRSVEKQLAATNATNIIRPAASEVAEDLPWIDVGAKIGMRFLNSAHIQRAVASKEATELVKGISTFNLDVDDANHEVSTPSRPQKPIHSMWTSLSSPNHHSQATQADLDSFFPGSPKNQGRPSATFEPKRSNMASGRRGIKEVDFQSDRNPIRDASGRFSAEYIVQHERMGVTLAASATGDVEASQQTSKFYLKRDPLAAGVKVAIPLVSQQARQCMTGWLQMGTVVSSNRIFIGHRESTPQHSQATSNALSVTVKLDRCFLRNGEFAELTFRVYDEWPDLCMPRHSKVPVGSCISTSYGIGVLVGWRVEDDCHVVRSLWQRRGAGSAHAYLNREAIHGTIEAAVGFRVGTDFGEGVVVACVQGGHTFEFPRFFVGFQDEGRHKGHVLELNRADIRHCHGAQFIPVIEHIREAANYQIQVDNYKADLRKQRLDTDDSDDEYTSFWNSWQECLETLWRSFLRAVDEDRDFDEGLNEFVSEIIAFLDGLDNSGPPDVTTKLSASSSDDASKGDSKRGKSGYNSGFWFVDLLVKEFQNPGEETRSKESEHDGSKVQSGSREKSYERGFAILKLLMKTVSIARADSFELPRFRLWLSVTYEFLLFCRTVLKVQQKNSMQSLEVWKRAWAEIVATFGPIKERIAKIIEGIKSKMETQGRRAKIRLLNFVDCLLSDERMLVAIEKGDWTRCLSQLENTLLKAKIIDKDGVSFYRKITSFAITHINSVLAGGSEAASRNHEKLQLFLKAMQSIASPRRSILKFLTRNDILELLERILVRAYCREDLATRMLNIHASNFHSLRHLRLLKDVSVSGRMWIPLLDAADEEFSWVVSRLPENSKEFMCPLSSIFSLGVAQFHKINAGDMSKDWLEFLLEEDSVRIIQDIDMKLILALESFSKDIREMLVVLPYYSSIDEDFLNLMDEVDLEHLFREASKVMDDSEEFSQFLREKATVAIERFLNYLPKFSIPVERRDLGGDLEGWVLTCRGEDGGDLTLSDINIRRENLICQMMGGDSIFFPMFGDEAVESSSVPDFVPATSNGYVEESILDDIRELILQARRHGCWKAGVGGIGQAASDRYVASVLQGLPVSSVLNCGIELWRNLEIDDDELMEIAIRDVAYQIELHKDEMRVTVDGGDSPTLPLSKMPPAARDRFGQSSKTQIRANRFNPRVDPTVLFLEMKNLKLHLDNFFFRIEKKENRTIFDPVFEGKGMVSLQNLSIRLRIDCAKEKVKRSQNPQAGRRWNPVLFIRELDVKLAKVKLKIKDTGFGSDWVLNQAVHVFQEGITKVVEENLREQIQIQLKSAIDVMNSYFAINPQVLLNILGVSIDDLDDEKIVWV